jgi:hypothetical protein
MDKTAAGHVARMGGKKCIQIVGENLKEKHSEDLGVGRGKGKVVPLL